MVWYGMVWYGMVWYGMVWYGMVLTCFGNVWYTIEVYVNWEGIYKTWHDTCSKITFSEHSILS
jgi:hypothetical protein